MRRALLATVAAPVAAAAALLGGVLGGNEGAAAGPGSLEALAAAVAEGRTAAAVRALEGRSDGASAALLGLAYLQRFRETGDAALLTRSEQALHHSPRRAVRTSGLASLAATRHRFREALRLAREAIRLDPEDPGAYGVLGDALVELGRYGEAFAAFDRMAVLAPGAGSYARIAQARELVGSREGALEALGLALELDRTGPADHAYLHTRIGKLHQDAGRLAAASRAYRAALRVRPGFPHARAGLALLELAGGRPADAVPGLRHVLRDLPSPEYAADLGDALAASGRPREAERAYALARRLERRLASNGVRTHLQSALLDLDRDRDRRAALARARVGHGERPGIEGEHVLAWALYKNGRCAEARAHSIRVLRLGTPDLDALYHRSLIEACLGNRAAATAFRAEVQRLNPLYLVSPRPSSRRFLHDPITS